MIASFSMIINLFYMTQIFGHLRLVFAVIEHHFKKQAHTSGDTFTNMVWL